MEGGIGVVIGVRSFLDKQDGSIAQDDGEGHPVLGLA